MRKYKKKNVSSKKHKQIFIVTNWQTTTKVKFFYRLYFLSKNLKNLIDKKFDKLQKKKNWNDLITLFYLNFQCSQFEKQYS